MSDERREAIFRTALNRLTAGPAAQRFPNLHRLISSVARHELYTIPAGAIRQSDTSHIVPTELAPFFLQYVIQLTSNGEIIPEDVLVGSNLLVPSFPFSGLLMPVTMQGRSPSGESRKLSGAFLVPGFASLPARVSLTEGTEVVILFGAASTIAASYDPTVDLLVVDLVH